MLNSQIFPILSRIDLIPRIDTYSLRLILILSSHLCLGLPKSVFPVGLIVKILKTYFPPFWLYDFPISIF
jgi:hypothetical protein